MFPGLGSRSAAVPGPTVSHRRARGAPALLGKTGRPGRAGAPEGLGGMTVIGVIALPWRRAGPVTDTR